MYLILFKDFGYTIIWFILLLLTEQQRLKNGDRYIFQHISYKWSIIWSSYYCSGSMLWTQIDYYSISSLEPRISTCLEFRFEHKNKRRCTISSGSRLFKKKSTLNNYDNNNTMTVQYYTICIRASHFSHISPNIFASKICQSV